MGLAFILMLLYVFNHICDLCIMLIAVIVSEDGNNVSNASFSLKDSESEGVCVCVCVCVCLLSLGLHDIRKKKFFLRYTVELYSDIIK